MYTHSLNFLEDNLRWTMSLRSWILEHYCGVEKGEICFQKVKITLDGTVLKVWRCSELKNSKFQSTPIVSIDTVSNHGFNVNDYYGVFNPNKNDCYIILNNEYIFRFTNTVQKKNLMQSVNASVSTKTSDNIVKSSITPRVTNVVFVLSI